VTTALVTAILTDDVIRVEAPDHPLIHDRLFEATDWDEDVADGTYATMVTYDLVPSYAGRPAGLIVRFDQDPVRVPS
jgi:hypothetical protein